MSTDTVTLQRVELPKPRDLEEFPVKFQPESEDSGSLAWRQINDILSNFLRYSGFPQPTVTSMQTRPAPLELPVQVVVAPGIVVGGDEYKERYGDIDLEQYRQQMSPELFKAFVRHIGCIPGKPDLELGDIVTTTE
jgi:hypothetical protein